MLRTLSGGEPSSNKWIILCAADKSVRYVKNATVFFVWMKGWCYMYQALYRKYRPKVFADVCGQDHITSTLLNEIREGRISHAYLFTGSRGTGKTTCAKILAKAVNCENSQNGEPCNECEMCRGLDDGTIYDVVEIDAASNNGVDNIRELREEANYTPSRGKYRVYIIDEVHMLSQGAFNALLKTLEEPPAHVIFILATTEVHKLPATILSRCQRFDFKRIQPETMAKRLEEVAGMENISLTPEAAVLIARIADGGMRDALSILDQCAGRDEEVSEKLVSEVAGIAGRESLYELSSAVADKNSGNALNIIAALHQNSYDMERLCVEMINHFRNFLIVKTVSKSRELIICTDDEYERIRQNAARFSLPAVIHALDLFQDTLVKIKGGANARIEMEMSFIKLCEPKLDESSDSVLERIAALENTLKNGVPVRRDPALQDMPQPVAAQPAKEENIPQAPAECVNDSAPQDSDPVQTGADMPDHDNAKEVPDRQENAVAKQQAVQPPAGQAQRQTTLSSEQREFSQWADFMEEIYKKDIALYGVLSGSAGYTRGEYFLIDSKNPALREFIRIPTHSKTIKQALYDVTGVHYKLGLFKHKTEESKKRDPLEDLILKAKGSVDIDIND